MAWGVELHLLGGCLVVANNMRHGSCLFRADWALRSVVSHPQNPKPSGFSKLPG